MMRYAKMWWSVALLAFLLQSCQHKELCMDHSHMVDVEIVFDWSAAPDAAPQTMVVQFFRMDGRACYRGEFTPSASRAVERGKVRLEAGEYRVLFHNGEMASVVERGNTYDDYELVTIPVSLLAPMGRGEMDAPPRPEGAEDEPVRAAPETVWGGCREFLEIRKMVSSQTVTLTPKEMAVECTVEVHNVKNVSDLLDISAALTGMSEGWRLADGVPSDVPVTMPIALHRVDEHTLEARFVSFGHCPVRQEKHVFSIYTSGKKYYNFDVSDQLHDVEMNPDPTRIHIVIDEEVDLSSSGDMSPSVSDWEEVITDINMN